MLHTHEGILTSYYTHADVYVTCTHKDLQATAAFWLPPSASICMYECMCVFVCVWVWKRNYCRKSSTYCNMQHMAQHSKVENYRYWLLWFSALAKDFYIFTYKITFIYICTLYIILAVLMLYPQHFRSLSLPLALLFNACCGILTGAQHPAHNRWQ